MAVISDDADLNPAGPCEIRNPNPVSTVNVAGAVDNGISATKDSTDAVSLMSAGRLFTSEGLSEIKPQNECNSKFLLHFWVSISIKILCITRREVCLKLTPGGGGTPYCGLYREVLPERGAFCTCSIQKGTEIYRFSVLKGTPNTV